MITFITDCYKFLLTLIREFYGTLRHSLPLLPSSDCLTVGEIDHSSKSMLKKCCGLKWTGRQVITRYIFQQYSIVNQRVKFRSLISKNCTAQSLSPQNPLLTHSSLMSSQIPGPGFVNHRKSQGIKP